MNGLEEIDRLEVLFHRARGLDRSERARFLAEISSSDPGLGAQLESLLLANDESGLVDAPAHEAATVLLADAEQPDLSGRSIDRYVILNLMGRGGMGDVYRARDTNLSREVALKFLPEPFAGDADRLSRFEREARVLAALNHPNIAAIHDLIECDGRRVLVLELVEGETLAERLERGLIPLPEALDISSQIADALRAAHKKGIVHRDLKPSNVKLTPEGQVKVLDFGLAKVSAGDAASSQSTGGTESLTMSGAILGTPAYMSPEQALGAEVDARSDIFSFGAVVYEMLTGKRAFSGANFPVLLHSVLSVDPSPPKTLRREIPADLDLMVMRSLRKSSDERQESMEQIGEVLTRLRTRATGRPSAFSQSAVEGLSTVKWRVQQWTRGGRRKGIAAWLLLALFANVGLASWRIIIGMRDAAPAGGTDGGAGAVVPVNRKSAPYELFQQGTGLLERWDLENNLNAAIEAFNAAIAKQQNYAPAYAGLGLAYVLRYRNNRDKSLLDVALQNANHAVELDPHLAVCRLSLGRAHAARGEYEAAEVELKEALTLDPLNADAYRTQADIERGRSNWAESERLYLKAIELRQGDWNLRYAAGLLYYRVSRFAEAEKFMKEAIDLAPDTFMVHRDLGAVYHIQGRFAEASTEFQRSLEIRPSAAAYSNLGTSLFFQGLYQQSVAAMEKAVETGANSYQTWANLGDAYRQTPGNQEKAIEAFQAAIQLVRGELSGNPKDGNMRAQLAQYLAKAGDKQQAVAETARAEELDQSPQVLATLVVAYEVCELRENALNSLGKALKKGYSLEEIDRDPELLDLRRDPRFRKLVVSLSGTARK